MQVLCFPGASINHWLSVFYPCLSWYCHSWLHRTINDDRSFSFTMRQTSFTIIFRLKAHRLPQFITGLLLCRQLDFCNLIIWWITHVERVSKIKWNAVSVGLFMALGMDMFFRLRGMIISQYNVYENITFDTCTP